MGEAGEDHGHGIVGGQGEVGGGDERAELFDDSGEDRVGEAVEGPPLGVAEVRLEGPNMLRGEGAEGGDGEVRRGGGRWGLALGGFRGLVGGFGGGEGEEGGKGEEEKGRGGGRG